MTFANYLKAQLSDLVDSYKKYYIKTNGTAVAFTLIAFVCIALLFHFSLFDITGTSRNISLLSYFFVRYSVGGTYSLVDLSKTVFLFFVCLYSISLSRQERAGSPTGRFHFPDFVRNIHANDFPYLLVVLAVSALADYFLFKLDSFLFERSGGSQVVLWVHGLLFLLRIYIPLILFSLCNYKILTGKTACVTIRRVLWLFVTLWLVNEMVYEFSLFVRAHVFAFLLLPFPLEDRYLVESILGVALVSSYFPGYHVAMTRSMFLLNEEKPDPDAPADTGVPAS